MQPVVDPIRLPMEKPETLSGPRLISVSIND
jgi:hypothetical protein